MTTTPISQLSLAQLRETLQTRDRQLAQCEAALESADRLWQTVLAAHQWDWTAGVCQCLAVTTYFGDWLAHVAAIVQQRRAQEEA